MASVASQLIEEITAHAQRDSLEDAREICTDSTYLLNNLRILYEFNVFTKTPHQIYDKHLHRLNIVDYNYK